MRAERFISLLLLLCICLSLVGCGSREITYCEIGLTLPRSYRSIDASGNFDLAFKDGGKVIGIRRLSFDAVIKEGILATHTALKFAEIYRDALGLTSLPDMREHGDIPYFSYTKTSSEGSFVYTPTFYRTPYAYFIVVLVSENNLQVGERVAFLEICDSFHILPEYL